MGRIKPLMSAFRQYGRNLFERATIPAFMQTAVYERPLVISYVSDYPGELAGVEKRVAWCEVHRIEPQRYQIFEVSMTYHHVLMEEGFAKKRNKSVPAQEDRGIFNLQDAQVFLAKWEREMEALEGETVSRPACEIPRHFARWQHPPLRLAA
ncbi:MAG: hypothetical protein SFW62_05780 [Alphaproteobacteria bacterium]|nr:hypothetical protein [Alphaproteobacteria bacterium]